MLHHIKDLGGRFSLSLIVDDVDNEPPVLLESCNISLGVSSAGAMGIKRSVWYERTKSSGRFLSHLFNLHIAHFYLFFFVSLNCLCPIFLISRLSLEALKLKLVMFFNNMSLLCLPAW